MIFSCWAFLLRYRAMLLDLYRNGQHEWHYQLTQNCRRLTLHRILMLRRATAATAAVVVSLSCLTFAETQAQEQQLLGRWRFAPTDVRGSEVRPAAGDLMGKVSGAVRFSDDQPQRLLLDGKTNQINLTEDLAQGRLPIQAISAEAWVRIDAKAEWGGIVGAIQDNGNFEKGWLLGNHNNQFLFGLSTEGANDGDGKLTYLHSSTVFEPAHWYHVVGTYDGQVQKIYVDGLLRGESTEQSGKINYPAKALYCIGAYRDDDEHHLWSGRLAEVGVYSKALSAEEVAARFTASVREFPDIQPVHPLVTGWPTYMRDNARTGIALEKAALPLTLRWSYQSRTAPAPAWPPPARQDFWNGHTNLQPRVIYDRTFHTVSAEGRVFFGSSADDQVTCLDLATGEQLWTFFTEGPVRLAPHLADGRVYFGSDDGCVYCLNTTDGALHWKFRAAPTTRRIAGNGRLISAWPVRTGVLVQDGVAHFAAGLFPVQGTYQFAVDAVSGEVIEKKPLEISPQGYLQRRGSELIAAAGRAPQAFFSQLRRQRKGSGAHLWKMNNDYPFALIGADDIRFVGGDGKIAALAADDGKVLWSAEVEGQAYSLAFVDQCLLVSTSTGNIYCFAPESTGPSGAARIVQSATVEFPYPNQNVREQYELRAKQIVAETGITKGYCLVLDSDQGLLVHELARQTELRVIGIEKDPHKVAASRAALQQAGLYGRAAIIAGATDQLPIGDCLINLVVVDRGLRQVDASQLTTEVARVLRPAGGVAYFGPDAKLARGPVVGAGEWTHLYANPANTACSEDSLVKGPLAIQWFGRPGPRLMIDRHHRTAAPLCKDGRVFIPGDNHLFVVDAYNGTPLWNCEVPGSRRIGVARDHGNMVVGSKGVFVVAQDQCHRFDVQTGAQSTPLETPSATDGKPRHWGYVGTSGDLLLGTATKPGASRSGHSKAAIQEGTYWDFREIVTSDFVFSRQTSGGKLVWKYAENKGAILNPTLTVGGNKMYFVESNNSATLAKANGRSTLDAMLSQGANLVALDLKSGKVAWKIATDFSEIQHHLYLSYARDVLVAVGSRNVDTGKKDNKGRKIEHVWYDTHAIDARTGELLWTRSQDNQVRSGGEHGEQDHRPAVVGETVYVEPYAYDLLSGEPRTDWKLSRGGHGCGTVSASSATLFFRAGNPTMCDLATGQNAKVNLVSRPGCWINSIPAGGLLLIPEASSGCTCNFPLQTSMAFIPESLLADPSHLARRDKTDEKQRSEPTTASGSR